MTVSSTNSIAGPYIADGVNRAWPYSFSVDEKSDIVLTVEDLDGVVYTIATGSFSVLDLDDPAGSVITYPILPIDPLPAGWEVLVTRATPVTQPSRFGNQGTQFPNAVEAALDRVIRINQELTRRVLYLESIAQALIALDTSLELTAASVLVEPTGEMDEANVQLALEAIHAQLLDKAPLAHTHPMSEVTGLVAALAGKIPMATLSTKGDILAYDAAIGRFPVGADGKYLKALASNAFGFEWGSAGVVENATYDASATWFKPLGLGAKAVVRIRCWGGGGGGGIGSGGSDRASGGGGGGFNERWMLASDLPASLSMLIGAGGAPGSVGGVGGNTTFGSYLTAYGGGWGHGNNITAATAGGGGGGPLSAGTGGVFGTSTRTNNSPWPSGRPIEIGISTDEKRGRGRSPWHGGHGAAGGVLATGYGAAEDSVFGGGGGANQSQGVNGLSAHGGNGGTHGVAGSVPGGGGGSSASGGQGRIHVLIIDGG